MLSYNFVKYIESTKNVCFYKLSSEFFSDTLCFPNVQTVSLIHCNRNGISNILKPEIFPNLQKIHYLSGHPGQIDIYLRFNHTVKWIFPNKKYEFYNHMIEAGKGLKDDFLIVNHISNIKMINQFMEFDLYLPGFSIVDGMWYRTQQYQYLTTNYQNSPLNIRMENECISSSDMISSYSNRNCHPIQSYIKQKLDNDFFNSIMKQNKAEERFISL
jgi:hypothetical protein